MKYIFALIAIFALSLTMNAQDKYITKTGYVWFFSTTPVEDIQAHNKQVASVIDVKKGNIAFDILIKSFKFEKALMEEHFNENYMESDKFPKSTFAGKISNFDVKNFKKNGLYNVQVEGKLTIHGVTKDVKHPGTIEIKDGKIYAKSKFPVSPEEYGIKIPAMAKEKIAKVLDVNVDMVYSPK